MRQVREERNKAAKAKKNLELVSKVLLRHLKRPAEDSGSFIPAKRAAAATATAAGSHRAAAAGQSSIAVARCLLCFCARCIASYLCNLSKQLSATWQATVVVAMARRRNEHATKLGGDWCLTILQLRSFCESLSGSIMAPGKSGARARMARRSATALFAQTRTSSG